MQVPEQTHHSSICRGYFNDAASIDTSACEATAPATDCPEKAKPARSSALATARKISDLSSVTYPEGVNGPATELNINAKGGKFRYDREFLLQFMSICKEKPDMLPPLDTVGIKPSRQISLMIRHNQTLGPSMPFPFNREPVGSEFTTNTYLNKPRPTDLFMTHHGKRNKADTLSRSRNGYNIFKFLDTPPASPTLSATQIEFQACAERPVLSNSLEKLDDTSQVPGNGGGQYAEVSTHGSPAIASNDPKPLAMSLNRWSSVTITRNAVAADSTANLGRRVKALLNKLTLENFDSISDQIIAWADMMEGQKNAQTISQIAELVLEHVVDGETWSEMYARLCRKMMKQICSVVQDTSIKTAKGKPIVLGGLFRKYLVDQCQEAFERGPLRTHSEKEEAVLYSDEYYTARKAKRRYLGLVKFIGELFKQRMLNERVIHQCVKILIGNVRIAKGEEIEALSKLLPTVGAMLDTPRARAHMDIHFARMKELVMSPVVTPRIRFMLQDVIELRKRNWIPRRQCLVPTTISQTHETVAAKMAALEISSQRHVKARDLSNFGRVNKLNGLRSG